MEVFLEMDGNRKHSIFTPYYNQSHITSCRIL